MATLYKTADALRALNGKKRPHTSAVIVAAGGSTRMGGTTSKQLLEVGGIPVLARTMLAFENTKQIDEIVVVARAADLNTVGELAALYRITKLIAVVSGGATRAKSAQNGFMHISNSAKFVVIHDGARCLVTPEMIEKVLRAAYRHKAATAVAPVFDTVKTVDSQGFIKKTVDRKSLMLATTPQVFSTNLYRAAIETVKDTEQFTDDNQMMESLPFPVKTVNCGRENIKITEPLDLLLAECILAERKTEE
ncbi:MAG: 2-C-methyl-D-erythritol 4-phosphate cytidylyltransferase [Clostridia bacterium]|nr:2-C-methyl-D-erythritol 4-phosphate cytidylyltransferase [Clostridia bacterium]